MSDSVSQLVSQSACESVRASVCACGSPPATSPLTHHRAISRFFPRRYTCGAQWAVVVTAVAVVVWFWWWWCGSGGSGGGGVVLVVVVWFWWRRWCGSGGGGGGGTVVS